MGDEAGGLFLRLRRVGGGVPAADEGVLEFFWQRRDFGAGQAQAAAVGIVYTP